MAELLNIGQAAKYLNVSVDTLRLWDKNGKLLSLKTPGGHRRYDRTHLNSFIGVEEDDILDKQEEPICATYA